MSEDENNEFSVWLFFPDPPGGYFAEARWINAEEAVKLAKECTERPAAKLGMIAKIIITDAADCTCFEWLAGKGVVYPIVAPP